MTKKLQHLFALSERGAKDLVKAVLWCFVCNVGLMLPVGVVMAVIFAVLMLGVVSGAAVLFQWFPLDQMGSWLWFVGIFLVGFAAITLVFELVFRFKRREYDAALGRYKRQNPGQ